MTYKLYNHLRDVQGYTFAEKTILKDLASISRDDETVLWSMENLCHSLGCSERTARRNLRRIEEKTGIIPQCEIHGRGHVLSYRFNVGFSPVKSSSVDPSPVESVPVAPPETLPPANGHKPAMALPRNSYTPDPLSPEALAKRRADAEALRARLASKRTREEPTRVRTGRTERERARMVQGESPLGGSSGGDETP